MKTQHTIYSIQALRAIAATMVVVFHAVNHLHARNLIPEIPGIIDIGRAGVDIFFIISGFIMVWICGQKFGTPNAPKDFIIKRIIRVAPTYWIYTLLMAILAFLFPHLISQGKTVSIQHLLASLSFVPWENNVGQLKPILSVGWTLNFEMYFYVIFGTLLFLKETYFLPILTTLLIFGISIGSVFTPPPLLSVITSPLLIEFLLGCTIAIYYKYGPRIPNSLLIIILLIGLSSLITTGIISSSWLPRVVKWGIPSALIVASIVFLERAQLFRPSTLLTTLGNSSYSLYLSHIFTINVIGLLWAKIFNSMHMLFVITATIISIIGGHIAYLLLEKPITTRLNNLYLRASHK